MSLNLDEVITPSVNPLLQALKLPGRVLPIPSKGFFYKNGELADDIVNGEVQVFAMSGLAEMKLRSPDLLFSGKAVEEIIQECIPAIKKPADLLSKDVDTLLGYIRMVTYGPTIDVKYQHDCKNSKEHNYQLNLEKLLTETVILDEAIIS